MAGSAMASRRRSRSRRLSSSGWLTTGVYEPAWVPASCLSGSGALAPGACPAGGRDRYAAAVSESPPYVEIDTVFLDAGNTLVSIDFARVAAALGSEGLATTSEALRRAEARARPRISRRAHERRSTEGEDAFAASLGFVLAELGPPVELAAEERLALARRVSLEVREPGASDRLWCWPLPGTEEALNRLVALGLSLVVVSNSDGTVARGLEAIGLRRFFGEVIDSHEVGSEKPDARIFRTALERANAEPQRTLHVGDLYHADVLGARAADIHALLLDPYSDWGELDCPVLPDLLALAGAFEQVRS